MPESMLASSLHLLMTGWSGFAFYWAVLLGAAMLEASLPGEAARRVSGRRIAVNFGLGLATEALAVVPLLSIYVLAMAAESRGWGLFHAMALPFAAATSLGFVALDGLAWCFHFASHRWPLLWRLHRVHHSDNEIDVSTTFRNHPLLVPVNATVNFAAIAALGIPPAAVALFGLARLLTMALGHADLRARPGISRIIAKIFVTPEFHRRHHSAWRPETDSNYGEVLTFWDRLFGTVAHCSGKVERFGLGDDYDGDAASITAQLKLPFISR